MAINVSLGGVMDLADGNKIRIREDAAGYMLLGLKIGANAYIEVKVTRVESIDASQLIKAAVEFKQKEKA